MHSLDSKAINQLVVSPRKAFFPSFMYGVLYNSSTVDFLQHLVFVILSTRARLTACGFLVGPVLGVHPHSGDSISDPSARFRNEKERQSYEPSLDPRA